MSRVFPTRLGVFGALGALYLLLFPYHPGLRSPNELCRLWQTRALVEYGTLDINQALRDYGPVGDLSVKDGRYYPSKAPLLSFAAVPLYAVLRAAGGGGPYAVGEVPLVFFSRLLLTVLPTLLLLGLVRRFLAAHVSAGVADAVTVTYGLGSLAFSYSLLFMSHQTTAVLLFGGYYALWRVDRDAWGPAGYLVAGACAGATVAAEYTGALGVLGLVFYAGLSVLGREEPPRARGRRLARGFGLALLGALPFVAGLMLYHQTLFGHPLETGYKHLNDAAYQPWHLGGFLGIRFPDPRAFVLSFFSPLRGLFTLSPFLLLALPGLGVMRREARARPELRAHGWLILALLAGYTYFTSSFSYDSWGWTTGPRHLTGLVPFLLLPVALLLEWLRSTRRAAGAGAAAALCTASIVFTGLATFVNYVPDDVSNAVLGLALPLLRAGYAPPNVLNLLGLPNPAAGLLLAAVLLGLSAWVFTRLAGRGEFPGRAPWLAGLATVTVLFAFQGLTVRHSPQDLGAIHLLEQVWLVPPGQTLTFAAPMHGRPGPG